MSISRTKNTAKTFMFGIISKLVTILFPFITRTIIIYKLGAEYVGVTSLFTSVLQILNVSELGISSAISFCLYKPIAEGDTETINALMKLMEKLYKFIGIFILLVGMLLLPFLDNFIMGDYPTELNIYILYIIYLLNAAVSYLGFAYKGVLFEAYQQGAINHKILLLTEIAKYIIQIAILLGTENYYCFAAMLPLSSVIVTLATEAASRKMHPDIVPGGVVPNETRQLVKRKVFYLSAHSIAATLTNSIDNIVISASLGLLATAIYGNYLYIYSAIVSIIVIAYRAIKPGIGNSLYVDDEEKKEKLYKSTQLFCSWISMWCSICLMCLYQPFMKLWVGENYLLDIGTVVLIVLYFYGNCLKLSYSNIYIEVAGLWNKTLLRQIVVSLINLALDIVLVNKYGIAGIVFASFLATTVVALPLDISVTYRYVFHRQIKDGIMDNLRHFLETVCICVCCFAVCNGIIVEGIIGLAVKAIICAILPNLIMILIYKRKQEFIFLKEHLMTVLHVNTELKR